MNVTAVTPWLNHRELERDYWAALRGTGAEVLVIDNGSDPPLPNAVRAGLNLGFSAASNLGLNLARTDAVLFLNNDVAAQGQWIPQLLDALEPGVLVGAKLRTDSHGSVDGEPLPYLDGWCLLGMRDDLLELGGFDEEYEEPAYFSDNDLSLRARAAGMTLREVPVPLVHKENQTAGPSTDPAVQAATAANCERFIERARTLLALTA